MINYHDILINRISEENRKKLNVYKNFILEEVTESVDYNHEYYKKKRQKFEELKKTLEEGDNCEVNVISEYNFNINNFDVILKNDFFYIVNSYMDGESNQVLYYIKNIDNLNKMFIAMNSEENSEGDFYFNVYSNKELENEKDILKRAITLKHNYKYKGQKRFYLISKKNGYVNPNEKNLDYLLQKKDVVNFILENSNDNINNLIDMLSITLDIDLNSYYKNDINVKYFNEIILSLNKDLKESKLINKKYNKKNIVSVNMDIPF